MNITRQRVIFALSVTSWLILWHVAWFWLTQPRPVTRIELPRTAFLLSVSDTGLVSVSMDSSAPHSKQNSTTKVWDMKTGREQPLPFHSGDVPLSMRFDFRSPCFVLRDGCVHQIDAITGETLQRYEELRSASRVQASPDGSRLLVQSTPTTFDLFDISSKKVLWSYTPPDPKYVYWRGNEFVSAMDFTKNCTFQIDPSTGVIRQRSNCDTPYLVGKINGAFIAVDRFASIGLMARDVTTNQAIATLRFRERQLDSPNREQLRLSDDGASVLIDYVDPSGKVATFQWDLTDKMLDKRYSLAPFKVATNGTVLERRTIESPTLLRNIQREVRNLLRIAPTSKRCSSVFDPSGELLLRVDQTSDGYFYPGHSEELIDGGLGLVVSNNQGIEYYRVPPHGPVWFPYWLGLLVPPLAWWVTRQHRRQPPQPVASTA